MSIENYVFIGIILLFILIIIFIFNKMIFLRNGTRNTFSQVDILIRKRNNILSNLKTIIQAETKYENDVFSMISKLRSQVLSQDDISKVNDDIEKGFTISKTIIAIEEQYPTLKSNNSFTKYIKEIKHVENEILRMRHVYNNITETYNNYIQTFPRNIIASLFRFKRCDFFKLN